MADVKDQVRERLGGNTAAPSNVDKLAERIEERSDCCGAYAKGTDDGLVCRSCYAPFVPVIK
jgi:hypothetical protein